MAQQRIMQRFAKWHIWLAWLTGIPILMWTVTGLVMVIKPIEEVRGNHLRINAERDAALPTNNGISIDLPPAYREPVKSISAIMWRGQPVTRITFMNGNVDHYNQAGQRLPALDEPDIRQIVAQQIVGGDRIVSTTYFEAEKVPFDFRRDMPIWQVALEDGTHVYVNEKTGNIEAVRTRWWRVFDFMWGLHIMDLQTREDTSHPTLIIFATLGVIGSFFGTILMFRRRKARKVATETANA